MEEEYFPRGGARPPQVHYRQSANFLGKPEKAAKKRKRVTKQTSADDGYLSDEISTEYDKARVACASGIQYSSVKEGVLLLARVRNVLETKVCVSLPCRMEGTVMACHVSEAYNKQLQAYVNDELDSIKEIPKMFTRGQYVAVRVLEVKDRQLMLSMMPQHVNGGWVHTNIRKGVLLQGAVLSVEDHGYVIDVGIPKATVFLPKTMAHDDIQLGVGQLTWCAVKKCATEPDSSIITVTNKLQSIQESFIKYRESDKKSIGSVLPGMACEFIIDKPLSNGIEGRIFNDIKGYVQRCHSDNVKGKKPRLGEKVRARLLYVMPMSKVPFFSMKGIFDKIVPDLAEEQNFKNGDIVNAKVMKISGRSIVFRLGERDTGLLSLRRVRVDEDLTDEDIISKSYPLGSVHRVRVLCYNLCDYTYSCSDEPHLLLERYFVMADVRAGDFVDAIVMAVSDSNIVLTVGRLTGLVSQMHLSDLGVYVDPKKASNSKLTKKRFKVGQQVRARVLVADEDSGRLHLTLKPSLLDPDLDILKSCSDAVVGKSYKGFIKYTDSAVVVGFFNNVSALVPPVYVSREPTDGLFHLGQIVNCTILKVILEKNKLIGSLTTAPFEPSADGRRPKRKINDSETSFSNKQKKEEKGTNGSGIREPYETKKKKRKESASSDDGKSKNKQLSESAASDAEETAQHNDTEEESTNNVLTKEDMALINLDDCVTTKHFKKRVVSLMTAVNNRIRRLNIVQEKIDRLEEKGITGKNKKAHTAMHAEKVIIEERIKILLAAVKTPQDKLKDFSEEECGKKDYKRKKKDSATTVKEEDEPVIPELKQELKIESIGTPKVGKGKVEKIKVADSTTPALEVPSVKDFWSLNADTLSKNVTPAHEEAESSSSDDEAEEQPKKKRKKLTAAEKEDKLREEEEKLRAMERNAALDGNQPQSSDQFERLLLANPNSSELWIAYMAFYLQATEIDKARAVGRKALKTISFREEQEKFNVWLAMLNFENRFGTKESQQQTLDEALQMNDPFKVHSKLLDIYQETNKVQELSSLVDLMLKKYKREPTMYTLAANALYRLGLVDKSRSVMQKAISILDKKEHIAVIVQFAKLERAFGDAERAEALLEQVVGVYPQRTDVWSVYVDMLYKSNDIDNIRQVMERAVSHKMAARKMKVLYQKWIDVEERIGDAEQIARIRQKALNFIEKAKF